MLEPALGKFSPDLAIDLGTTTLRVAVRGRGLVVEEPAVLAVRQSRSARQVVAVGQEAKSMVGRTPENLSTVHPIQAGVVSDFELIEALLRHAMQAALGARPLVKPRAIVNVSATLGDVERRAVQEAVRASGAREVALVAKSVAAAVGAGLPIDQPKGNLVVDVGGGTTEVCVLSLGGIVTCQSTPAGGMHFDQAIQRYLEEKHRLLIGEATAEQLKIDVGAATQAKSPRRAAVKGRDVQVGIPRELVVTQDMLVEALGPSLDTVVEVIRLALQHTPPELASDILDHGLILCGGASQLAGLSDLLRQRTGMPVVSAEDPARATVLGAAKLLDEEHVLARLTVRV